MELLVPFLSDLIAGLTGAAILAGLALLFHKTGSERVQAWTNKLRRLGWKLLAFVFFVTALMSAILQPPSRPIAVALGTILVLVLASFILLRFGPAKIRRFWATIRAQAWPILTGLFFLSTVMLLVIGIVGPPPTSERIVFVVDVADEEWIALREILDELEPELGAEVFLMSVNSKYYVARLHKMEASNNMRWDLMAVDNNILGILWGRGLVEELPDEVVPSNLLSSLKDLLLKFEGKLCFVPFRPNVKIAFYNEEKFDKYGLKPPETWDELLEVAKVFYEKEGVGRVAIQGYPGKCTAVTVFEFVTAAGGNPLTLDDDESWKAFVFLKELEPYLAEEYKETRFDTANELLISDVVYLVSNWPYGIKVVIEDAGKEIKVYSGWRGPQREAHVLGGDVLAVPKGAPHKKKAIKLIELLLEKETQQKLFSRLRWPPARFDAYELASPYSQCIQDALYSAVLRTTSPQWTLVEGVLDSAFGELVREGKDISTLDKYRDMLKQIPSEYIGYTVVPGDTLEMIARRHNTTVDFLAKANGITPHTSVIPKQILLVPQE